MHVITPFTLARTLWGGYFYHLQVTDEDTEVQTVKNQPRVMPEGWSWGWNPGRLAPEPSSYPGIYKLGRQCPHHASQPAWGKDHDPPWVGAVRGKESISRKGRGLRSVFIAEGQLASPTLSCKTGIIVKD